MPKYLVSGGYTHEGVKGLLKEGGSSRREAVTRAVESLGGTVESFYYAFGSDDFFITVDFPDHVSAAAASLFSSAAGTSNVRVTVLLTPEEVDQAVAKSPDYRAPGR
jgi:uncharacterized protein with GYD domain